MCIWTCCVYKAFSFVPCDWNSESHRLVAAVGFQRAFPSGLPGLSPLLPVLTRTWPTACAPPSSPYPTSLLGEPSGFSVARAPPRSIRRLLLLCAACSLPEHVLHPAYRGALCIRVPCLWDRRPLRRQSSTLWASTEWVKQKCKWNNFCQAQERCFDFILRDFEEILKEALCARQWLGGSLCLDSTCWSRCEGEKWQTALGAENLGKVLIF